MKFETTIFTLKILDSYLNKEKSLMMSIRITNKYMCVCVYIHDLHFVF